MTLRTEIVENIEKLYSLGFTYPKIATLIGSSRQVVGEIKNNPKYYVSEKLEKEFSVKLQEFSDNCKNPEYITMLKLRDLYQMPNATMQELMGIASKRVENKISEYKAKICTDI